LLRWHLWSQNKHLIPKVLILYSTVLRFKGTFSRKTFVRLSLYTIQLFSSKVKSAKIFKFIKIAPKKSNDFWNISFYYIKTSPASPDLQDLATSRFHICMRDAVFALSCIREANVCVIPARSIVTRIEFAHSTPRFANFRIRGSVVRLQRCAIYSY
jgi:hypothetical protein